MSGVQHGMTFHPAHQTASCTEYCAPNLFHIQDYIEMHVQQNIIFFIPLSLSLSPCHIK